MQERCHDASSIIPSHRCRRHGDIQQEKRKKPAQTHHHSVTIALSMCNKKLKGREVSCDSALACIRWEGGPSNDDVRCTTADTVQPQLGSSVQTARQLCNGNLTMKLLASIEAKWVRQLYEKPLVPTVQK